MRENIHHISRTAKPMKSKTCWSTMRRTGREVYDASAVECLTLRPAHICTPHIARLWLHAGVRCTCNVQQHRHEEVWCSAMVWVPHIRHSSLTACL